MSEILGEADATKALLSHGVRNLVSIQLEMQTTVLYPIDSVFFKKTGLFP